MTEAFTQWVDKLDEANELTVEQLILMNEAWEASKEHSHLLACADAQRG